MEKSSPSPFMTYRTFALYVYRTNGRRKEKRERRKKTCPLTEGEFCDYSIIFYHDDVYLAQITFQVQNDFLASAHVLDFIELDTRRPIGNNTISMLCVSRSVEGLFIILEPTN